MVTSTPRPPSSLRRASKTPPSANLLAQSAWRAGTPALPAIDAVGGACGEYDAWFFRADLARQFGADGIGSSGDHENLIGEGHAVLHHARAPRADNRNDSPWCQRHKAMNDSNPREGHPTRR